MTEKNALTTQATQEATRDTLSFDDAVVEKIVAITCQDVDGILEMKGGLLSTIQENFGGTDLTKGVDVSIEENKRCDVDLSIIMEYGKSAPKIFASLRSVISENVKSMTGLTVDTLNVRVVDVMTQAEYRKLQAKREESALEV